MIIDRQILKKLIMEVKLGENNPAPAAPAAPAAAAPAAGAPAAPAAGQPAQTKPAAAPPELQQLLTAAKTMNPQAHAKVVAYLKTLGVQVQ